MLEYDYSISVLAVMTHLCAGVLEFPVSGLLGSPPSKPVANIGQTALTVPIRIFGLASTSKGVHPTKAKEKICYFFYSCSWDLTV